MRAMGGRPVLLQRFPDGASGPSFFQKRVDPAAMPWLQTAVVSTPNGTTSDALVAADLQRPAAIDQLAQVGDQVGVPVYAEERSDPVKAVHDGIERAKAEDRDVVILDTAGRLHVDEALMEELAAVRREAKPTNVLLVLDAMTGQEAVNVAQAFQERIDFDGVVLTKLDGDARGGAALSVKAVTGKPIKLASTGEKVDQLEWFHPDRMASRILGMGDVLTLIERA